MDIWGPKDDELTIVPEGTQILKTIKPIETDTKPKPHEQPKTEIGPKLIEEQSGTDT